MKVGLVVEGHGEVQAVPLLLRRLPLAIDPDISLDVPPPLRVSRGKLVKEHELRRAVDFMARKTAPDGALLVVLDANHDCTAELAPRLLQWAADTRADRRVAVVLAIREYEAWLVAAARSLRGTRGLPDDLTAPPDPEQLRNPKAWLAERMPNGYSETIDQAGLTAAMDLTEARACASFEKLERELRRLLGA